LGHVGLENLLHRDQFLDGGFNGETEASGQVFVPGVLTLFIVENIGILVHILGNVVVARLNKHFIRWEFEGNLLVVSLETDSRKNLGARDENRGEEIVKPGASIRDVIRVSLGHRVRPVGNFL
tara:strand:- start:3687 stop:4055 length:369 start_codon:yes stop_codon:yes gene_type:complete